MENRFYNYFSYYNWWKNIDKFILGIIITLFSIGLFFSLVSTSLIASDKLDTNSYFFFFKHLIFVTLGLIIVFIFSYLSIKLKFAEMPNNSDWIKLYGVGVLTCIGFTMSLFVGNLAFVGAETHMDGVKIGVLLGSLLSTIFGYSLIFFGSKK